MNTIWTEAALFISDIGSIVKSLVQGNFIMEFWVTVMTLFCTLKIIGKLSYRESGG